MSNDKDKSTASTHPDEKKNKTSDEDNGKSFDDYGYCFYPQRTPGKVNENIGFWTSMKQRLLLQHLEGDKFKCVANIQRCIASNAKVKLLLRALEAHGCPVDAKRHLTCDYCAEKVARGGFDMASNQIVVCQNINRSTEDTCHTLAQQLLLAYDYCRAKIDPTNAEHLACTTIRGANLFDCTIKSAHLHRVATITDYDQAQMRCVKEVAVKSVRTVRNFEEYEVEEAVRKVFDRCYRDMEPFGRHLRENSRDPEQALRDGMMYGYNRSKIEEEKKEQGFS